jgi:hypothetical protein
MADAGSRRSRIPGDPGSKRGRNIVSQRIYAGITALIFFVVAMAHLSRLIVGWEIEFAGALVPHWLSIPGLIVPGLLSAWGFKLSSRPRTRWKYSA